MVFYLQPLIEAFMPLFEYIFPTVLSISEKNKIKKSCSFQSESLFENHWYSTFITAGILLKQLPKPPAMAQTHAAVPWEVRSLFSQKDTAISTIGRSTLRWSNASSTPSHIHTSWNMVRRSLQGLVSVLITSSVSSSEHYCHSSCSDFISTKIETILPFYLAVNSLKWYYLSDRYRFAHAHG